MINKNIFALLGLLISFNTSYSQYNCANTIGTFVDDMSIPTTYNLAQANGECFTIPVNACTPSQICFEYKKIQFIPDLIDIQIIVSDNCSNTTYDTDGSVTGGCLNIGGGSNSPFHTGFETYGDNCNLISNDIAFGTCTTDSIITVCVNINPNNPCSQIYICPLIKCTGVVTGCAPPGPPPACPPFNIQDSSFIDVCTNGLNSGIATVTPISPCSDIHAYQWDANANNQTTQTATGLSPGIYDVIVTNQSYGCDTTISVLVDTVPSLLTDPVSINICLGDSVFLGGAFQTLTGMYIDTILTSTYCDTIRQTTLTVTDPNITAGLDDSTATLCNNAGSTLDLNTLLSNGTTPNGTWIETTNPLSGQFNPSTGLFDGAGLTTGTYTFTYSVTGTGICAGFTDFADFEVTIGDTITAGLDSLNTTLCNNAGSTLDLNTFLSNGTTPNGTWMETTNPLSGQFNPSTGVFDGAGLNSGTYTFTYSVTGTGICANFSDTSSITINVVAITALINATPTIGVVPLNVFFGNGGSTGTNISYNWDFGDGNTSNQFEPTNTYSNIGDFLVVLIVTDGICTASDTVTITTFGVSTLIIPNIFTPNEDGINDVFKVDGINIKSFEGIIYNRWGQQLFSWNGINNFWDGRTESGSQVPSGSYFYIIKAEGLDGVEYFKKGALTLLR